MATNMKPEKTPMPEQDPMVRNRNFEEVAYGYTHEMAIEEAQRCLQCKHAPCIDGCPVQVKIPNFIKCILDGDMDLAYDTIRETSSLPAVCGRVCPQERQCEEVCVRGIKHEAVGIGRLERYVADWKMQNGSIEIKKAAPNGHKVAVLGAGPAGLTCAGDLCAKGYDVTIFEALHTAGGVLMYGIPDFRLPKDIVQKEIDGLRRSGVKIETNMVIGQVLSVDELFDMGFEAVFIGTGAGLPRFMNIPGEGLNGVYSANEFLTRINLIKAYSNEYDTPINCPKRVAVIGGGNVSMDAARSAKRLGADEVYVVYRRGEAEMPARLEEIHHAKAEGIVFKLLHNPVALHGDEDGNVVAIECVKMELGEPDASGRRSPVAVEGSNFKIEVDSVIMAIGNSPNPLILQTTEGIEDRRGCIVVDENMRTTRKGVYAGGDTVTGAATVILAMGAGRDAAAAIDSYLQPKLENED